MGRKVGPQGKSSRDERGVLARMTKVNESIKVEVPVRTAYDQWTQFESFPHFMEGVEEVHQINDTMLHWKAKIGGAVREWDAKIVHQEPDRRVAWMAIDGATNAGEVIFRPIEERTTEVTLELDYEPEGFVEKTGAALGTVQRRVKGDLERFKEFIEARGHETGAWRGEVHGGERTS
jgi:uncharacterized membrane protein